MARFFKKSANFSDSNCQIRRSKLNFNYWKTEKGFTYVEVIVSLTLLVILIPGILFFANNFMSSCERLSENNKFQLDQMSFVNLLFNELSRGKDCQIRDDNLEFLLPERRMIVRYERMRGELRRRIRYVDENHFQANSVLMLQHVEDILWRVDSCGVYLKVRMGSRADRIYEFDDYVAARC